MAESKDTEFLKKVRDRYRKAADYWRPIQEEAATDMRYVTGDPWSDRDKEERRQQQRPALASDELQQYLNQAINQYRQNKRGIKIQPQGEGANDKTATLMQDIIRGIEYNSVAQQNAYIPAIEDQIQRSYGFYRLTRQYIGESFRQEILIKGIPNADAVLFDPAVKEADWSDAGYVFVLDPLPRTEYEHRYGKKASLIGFNGDDSDRTSDWVNDDSVLTAEYWEIEKTTRTKLLLDHPKQGAVEVFDDELPEEKLRDYIQREREVETKSVCQYIVNGVAVLEKKPQPGTIIPIFAVIGKEMWVPEGGKHTRKIFSMIRLAREPYMQYCYAVTLLNEELAQIPKTKVVGAVGQFKTDKEAWDSAAFVPHSYLQYDPITDATQQQTLPPPEIWQYEPNAQSFAIVMDDARRRIMSALGLTPLPTAAQRRNDKSGVALDKISQQEQIGSFHFTDNADRASNLCGRCLLEWIPEVYNDEREMQLPQEDGTMRSIRINTDQPYKGEDGQEEHYPISEELDHAVTISTGPSYQSQRNAADDFLEQLMSNLQALPVEAGAKAKLLSLAIKLKDLGPLGDAMAEVISPDDPNAPQLMQQKIQQVSQEAQQLHEYAKQLEAKIHELDAEKQGKIVDNEYRMKIEQMKIDAQIAIAEIGTKAQNALERARWELDAYKQLHSDAHEAGMQAVDQAHQQDMAQQQAEQAQQTQASDQEHQAAMAQQAQEAQQEQPSQ